MMLRIVAGDGGKKARSPGRARRKPLTPSRAGMPGYPGATVVTNSCVYYFYTRGCGCNGHPAFPTPSLGEEFRQQLGRIAPRDGSRPSSPAGDPVFLGISDGAEKLRRSGYSAGACHRARRRRDPVAEYDDFLHKPR
jgi:hypothetical protein